MSQNWIERRFAREENLRAAATVWEEAKLAITAACTSFRQHYTFAKVVVYPSPTELAVEIVALSMPGTTRHVAIRFDASTPAITVRVNAGTERVFPIEADEDHAYIEYDDQEISLDDFSRLALEDAFFNPVKVKVQSQSVPSSGTGDPNSWMG